MDEGQHGGPVTPIKINEIEGLMTYLKSIDWSDPWFLGLGLFHATCILLTISTRKTGAIQSIYFGILLLLVFCAEQINQMAAEHWALFAKEQYFDSNGLFISIVFSTPLLINCLVIVVYWLWDVGVLISDVKRLKYKRSRPRPAEEAAPVVGGAGNAEGSDNVGTDGGNGGQDSQAEEVEESKKNK